MENVDHAGPVLLPALLQQAVGTLQFQNPGTNVTEALALRMLHERMARNEEPFHVTLERVRAALEALCGQPHPPMPADAPTLVVGQPDGIPA